MSYLHLNPKHHKRRKSKGSIRKAFSDFLLENYGETYSETLEQQMESAKVSTDTMASESIEQEEPLMVGIIGGGFAGMYAGLILQSLDIDCEIFEASDRVGGRIDTWYSEDYDPNDPNRQGLYGEVGGMRVPQFADDMLPVQQLALCLNEVLRRNHMEEQKVEWRKFYYNSPVQRLRFNNMPEPITAAESSLNALNFGKNDGGDLPMVWVTAVEPASGDAYLPVNKVLDQVNGPFLDALDESFEKGFTMLMEYDNYSMWGYLTNVFTLGDLGDYYQPEMGPKTDKIPFSVASYLETTNVGTGMYAVSFVEMVIAVYDWGGSLNPYDHDDPEVYMVTVDKGMQHFPDACRAVLNLEHGVLPEDGQRSQMLLGQIKGLNKKYGYSPPNLTEAAHAPDSVPAAVASPPVTGEPSGHKKRVYMGHKVTQAAYDANLYPKGGMRVAIETEDSHFEKTYPYVISTLPNGKYLNGQGTTNFFENLSFAKARALRECNYMPSFKAFITFKDQFWARLGERQTEGLGVAASDRPNRQIVYPSYGYDAEGGVLQIYCWAQDAERMGALTDKERVNECLKGIQYLYPEVDVNEVFAGFDPEVTTKTWFWDSHAGGGAFALFGPGQFKNLYPTLLTPEFEGCLNLAGECCSVHHGWIVGALDSAYNAVKNILTRERRFDKIQQMQATWGALGAPDVATLKQKRQARKVTT